MTFIGNNAGSGAAFNISLEDRFRHCLIVGATGTGKSTLLERIAESDIRAGHGLLFIDPHGESALRLLGRIPKRRINHVCYLDAAEADFPVSLNILERPNRRDHYAVVADGFLAAMRSIWGETGWGDRMEDILRNSLVLLVEYPDTTIASLIPFLTQRAYRQRVVDRTTHPVARAFFLREFESWSDDFREKAISPILNKLREFLMVPTVSAIFAQSQSTLRVDRAMSGSNIIIANLNKGAIGDSAADIVAAFLMARVLTHTMERSSPDKRILPPFHVIADEAATYMTSSVQRMASEGRKKRVSQTIGVQSLLQIRDDRMRSVMITNAATLVAYRTGYDDAELLARELQLGSANAVQDLGFAHCFARAAFSGDVYHLKVPPPQGVGRNAELVVAQSRRHYGKRRSLADRALRTALALDLLDL